MNNNIVGDPVGHDGKERILKFSFERFGFVENLRWNHDQYQLSQEATDNDTCELQNLMISFLIISFPDAPNHDIAAAIPDDNGKFFL